MSTPPLQAQPSEPPLTKFEERLHEVAEAVYQAGGTGYRWEPVDAVLHELPEITGVTRCKRAPGSGRAANVLTESNDKDIELYLVFIGPNYSRASFITAAEDRIKRFAKVKTVAVADKASDSRWRIRSFVERDGVGLADALRSHFPAVSSDDVHTVESALEAPAVVAEIEEPDEEQFASASLAYKTETEGLGGLVAAFMSLAAADSIQLDLTTASDLVAAALSSQLLLFAGPSGTGKSTYARLLARFFAPPDRWKVIDGRRQLLGPEELFGYYSVLAGHFATTPDTPVVVDLHESSVALIGDGGQAVTPPILLVEEINLSPIEAYLAPLTHGLSSVAAPYVRWPLHGRLLGASDPDELIQLPTKALLGPFPRCFGTINVDASALAPAPKVAGRACVILLEPQVASASAVNELAALSLAQASPIAGGEGATFLGDPRTGLKAHPDVTTQAAALVALLEAMSGGAPAPVSRRDLLRCALYMSYFELVTNGQTFVEDPHKIAAENAVLHFVLPTLSAERFSRSLEALLAETSVTLSPPPPNAETVGGLLGARLQRLITSIQSPFGLTDGIDYWSALS